MHWNMHCNGNSVYICLSWELSGLSPNFHIHVSVSDLYVPRIGPHISSSRKGGPIVGIYKSAHRHMHVEIGLRPRYSFSGIICFKFSAFCFCNVYVRCMHFSQTLWLLTLVWNCWPKKWGQFATHPYKSAIKVWHYKNIQPVNSFFI